jgi:cytochrome b subunit of formate dehydrogenase
MLKRKDIDDAFEVLMHNLGLTGWLYRKGILANFFRQHPCWLFKEPPKYGRYSFIEKFEYLAVVWGSFVMIVTGFFMWQVELAMRLFPKYIFDVFVAIHSYEAILAFLAIIVWHMYNVHFAPAVFPMSRVFLTGKISRKQMMEEHPLEYEEIQKKQSEKGPQ